MTREHHTLGDMAGAAVAALECARRIDERLHASASVKRTEIIAEIVLSYIEAERERCAKVADAKAARAREIAARWSPGPDGNDKTIAHWEARAKSLDEIAAAIRAG